VAEAASPPRGTSGATEGGAAGSARRTTASEARGDPVPTCVWFGAVRRCRGMNHPRHVVPATLLIALSGAATAQTTVFSSTFDGALPAQITPGAALLEGVQGYAGLGPAGNQFGGTFLRSPTGNVVTLQLTGLPPHDGLSLRFLFAAIDSLDGTGAFPSGDFFAIDIDGNTFFRESFANATPSQVQSYVSPPGVELARRVDLGFSGPGSYYTDSAYWLGADPQFLAIGHSAPSVTITLQITGPGIQPLGDESWAIDNLVVDVFSSAAQGSAIAYGASCGPSLSVLGTPRVGQPIPLLVQNLSAGTVLPALAIGLSDVALGAVPLPLPLDFLGAPGCWLHHDAIVNVGVLLLLQANAATGAVAIPNDPAYVGFRFFLQAWGFAPGVNALGITTSNGIRVQLGS
jgi:hypothetical protein